MYGLIILHGFTRLKGIVLDLPLYPRGTVSASEASDAWEIRSIKFDARERRRALKKRGRVYENN